MSTITERSIKTTFSEELARAQNLCPKWVHPSSGLVINRAKTAYGKANTKGQVFISQVFIGTEAHDDLLDTIRHELAHLIAGIPARHGPEWKRRARQLGAKPRSANRAGTECLKKNMARPLTLWAITTDGERIKLGTRHHRNKKYTGYRYDQDKPYLTRRRMSIRGKAITHFDYTQEV